MERLPEVLLAFTPLALVLLWKITYENRQRTRGGE